MTGLRRILQGKGLDLGQWNTPAVFDTNRRIARTYGFTLIQLFESTTIREGGLGYTGLLKEKMGE